jgi:prepilin-type N-terminal cleavage/methylation domain-containing protein
VNRRPPASPSARARPVGFTLLELLVVMGILLLLATLTAIGVGKVTRDAKLANATNVLVAALGNARAVAIRDNAYVMVTFRVAPDRRGRAVPREPQVVQVITARWTGEVVTPSTPVPTGLIALPDDLFADRFIAVPGVPARELPSGILVAGPAFGFVTDANPGQNDSQWRTQPRFAGSGNFAVVPPAYTQDRVRTELGWAIGVLFGPDGRMLSRNPEQVNEVVIGGDNQNAYVKSFVDLDGDGYPNAGTTNLFSGSSGSANVDFFVYDEPTDEPLVDYVPYLAVFNEVEARERSPSLGTEWQGTTSAAIGGSGNPPARIREQSLFIEEQSDRITFNRFSGVPQIVPK